MPSCVCEPVEGKLPTSGGQTPGTVGVSRPFCGVSRPDEQPIAPGGGKQRLNDLCRMRLPGVVGVCALR